MATLAEKIAAKKALAAGLAPMVDVTVQHVADTPEEKLAGFNKEAEQQEKEQEALCQQVPIEAEKPMTFAEKMALKKAQAALLETSKPAIQQTQSTVPPISPQPTNSSVVTAPIAKKQEQHLVQSQQPSLETEAEAKTAQAYADIKAKIELLSAMAEADLPGAMKELKASLLQNPQACYLMLPQDIGQMVIALRSMRQEAAVEATATKEKGPKKVKASKNLTAEEIAAAFDSL